MTYVEAFHATKDWKRRAYLIATFHNVQLYHNRKWKLIDSANYFKISIGSISEFLSINDKLEILNECTSKNAALKKIRK